MQRTCIITLIRMCAFNPYLNHNKLQSNKFPILDSSSQSLPKTKQPGSPGESECDRRRLPYFLFKKKTKMRPTLWPQPQRHLFLSCLMLGFCSHALHPWRLGSSCMTDDDSTLGLIPTIYTFQNHRCCHKGWQMVVLCGSKQNSHQEGCWPLSEHGKTHSNLTKNKKKQPWVKDP